MFLSGSAKTVNFKSKNKNMFKNFNCIAFFLLPWLIIGCSTTSRVNLDSPENTIEEINEVSQDRDVRIRKTDRTLFMGTDLSIRNDTVRWSGMNTEQAKELALAEVAQIQIIKRNKGAMADDWQLVNNGHPFSAWQLIRIRVTIGYTTARLLARKSTFE